LPADRGLIDTSVAVVLGTLARERLPGEIAVSALTLAELASGPHAARGDLERSRRQAHLQQIEASFESLPFDAACARSYGRVYAAVALAGRKPRGPRAVDLMIAATAIAHQLPLFTRNAADLHGLDSLLDVVDLTA
jgi:predicted nucleic acid-binding protein